ncbi:hypothetical protein [Streptomyces albidoflavus]|uniref:Uncharacterized protein n=1 Tax=Streptomyces albidoflavus TaxID=1886 RepID=A0A8G1ZT88_9ACTN|nr:hypothetical protein [Streptomyces albidoflavus]RZE26055.1 hypothetical protein C0Q92_07505 [Streptomyces albidoflavus]RZE47020.1 hypothetical protein C0Q95_06805 [Streptomyces albidoflavus]RZE62458.1 hypothetical protein C0Q98_07710 [Streptomyces albidoflavus]WSU14943.1 hypothetical protein OG330_07570 [Streptomyces albidoflavus]WTC29090.1 hypothetical protein OH749_07565 [Streptomyces albidoflavus]
MLTATRVDSEGKTTVAAQYYGADSENGDRIDDPSEDALFMMISDLNDSDNTFVVVQPDEDDPVWFASVAVLDEGGYETVRRDTTRNEHEVTTATSVNDIARDLTIWLAARDFPGRPTSQVSES